MKICSSLLQCQKIKVSNALFKKILQEKVNGKLQVMYMLQQSGRSWLIITNHEIVDGISESVIFCCHCSLDFVYRLFFLQLFVLHVKQSWDHTVCEFDRTQNAWLNQKQKRNRDVIYMMFTVKAPYTWTPFLNPKCPTSLLVYHSFSQVRAKFQTNIYFLKIETLSIISSWWISNIKYFHVTMN